MSQQEGRSEPYSIATSDCFPPSHPTRWKKPQTAEYSYVLPCCVSNVVQWRRGSLDPELCLSSVNAEHVWLPVSYSGAIISLNCNISKEMILQPHPGCKNDNIDFGISLPKP